MGHPEPKPWVKKRFYHIEKSTGKGECFLSALLTEFKGALKVQYTS